MWSVRPAEVVAGWLAVLLAVSVARYLSIGRVRAGGSRCLALVDAFLGGRLHPLRVHAQQVHEEVVAKRADAVGEHAVAGAAGIGAQGTHAADQSGHFRNRQRQQVGLVNQGVGRRKVVAIAVVIAEPVGARLQQRKGLDIGLRLRGIGTTRLERNLHADIRLAGSLLDSGSAAQDDKVSQRNALGAVLRTVEVSLDTCQLVQHAREFRRVVDFPVLLRRQADARAVGAAPLIGTGKGGCGCPRCGNKFRYRQP